MPQGNLMSVQVLYLNQHSENHWQFIQRVKLEQNQTPPPLLLAFSQPNCEQQRQDMHICMVHPCMQGAALLKYSFSRGRDQQSPGPKKHYSNLKMQPLGQALHAEP